MNRVINQNPAVADSSILAFSPHPMRVVTDANTSLHKSSSCSTRLVALAFLGITLGAGAAVLTVSSVQAFDEYGVKDFFRQQQQQKEAAQRVVRPSPQPIYYAPASYAPTRSISLPFFRTNDDGRLASPELNLNPFKKVKPEKLMVAKAAKAGFAKTGGRTVSAEAAINTVSGAANMPRTICVRVCDGFHAPLGYLTSQADLGAHDALCKAMNPSVPVKVYRIAAGATTIDEALGPDGKTYGAMPMAFSFQKAADPTCRPSTVQAGERRISVLKDFTLRPGDAVVLDGSARVFSGANSYPFKPSDFSDFRQSAKLTQAERRKIDGLIGQTFLAEAQRTARRESRVREVSLANSKNTAIDTPMNLRSSFGAINDVAFFVEGQRGSVRLIAPEIFMSKK